MKIFKIIVKMTTLVILILLLFSVLHSKYVRKDKIIKIFGKAVLIVTTGSMEPTIKSGELIIISEKDNYKIGDIVTFIDEDEFLITHRIIELEDIKFISKGDGNNVKDKPLNLNCIQGKVIFHSKIVGFFVLYLLKPICVLYAISIVVLEVSKINQKGDKENGKEYENKTKT